MKRTLHRRYYRLRIKYKINLLVHMIILALWTGMPQPVHAADKWKRYISPTLEVTSNLSSKNVKKLTQELEYMHDHISHYLALPKAQSVIPLRLYLTRSLYSVKKSAGLRSINGIYVSSLDGNRAAAMGTLAREDWQMGYSIISKHEYLHYLMDQKLHHALPNWYTEGLADFLSTGHYTKDQMILGKSLSARETFLKDENRLWISLKELFEEPTLSREKGGQHIVDDRRYALSWLLVHMLHMKEKYRSKLPAFVSTITKGGDSEKAFLEIYNMRLPQIRSALKAYLHKPGGLKKRIIKNTVRPVHVKRQTINRDEQQVMNWRMLIDFAHKEKIFAYVAERMAEHSTRQTDRNPSFQEIKARAYAGAKDYEKALDILSSIKRPHTKDQRLRLQKLQNEYALLDTIHQNYFKNMPLDRRDLRAIRRNLSDLITKDPSDPKLLYLKGLSYLLYNRAENNEIAYKLLHRAHQLTPNNTQIQYLLARAADKTGNHQKACAIFHHIKAAKPDEIYLTLANKRLSVAQPCRQKG